VFLQEPVEGQTFLAEPRDEVAQGGKAAQHLLHPLKVSNWAYPVEGRDFLGVGLDAPLGDNVSQHHAARHPDNAFFRVQFHPVSSQAIKCHTKIADQVVRLAGFHDSTVRLMWSPKTCYIHR
jgi:hypothetical protein